MDKVLLMLFCKNTLQTIQGYHCYRQWKYCMLNYRSFQPCRCRKTRTLLFKRFPIWTQLTACSVDAAVVLEVGKNPQLSWPWNTLAPHRFSLESTARGWMQNGVQTCQSPPHQWHGDMAGSRLKLLRNSYVPIVVSLTRLIFLPHVHRIF